MWGACGELVGSLWGRNLEGKPTFLYQCRRQYVSIVSEKNRYCFEYLRCPQRVYGIRVGHGNVGGIHVVPQSCPKRVRPVLGIQPPSLQDFPHPQKNVTSTSANTQPQQLANPPTSDISEQQALPKKIKFKEGRIHLDPQPFACLLGSRYVYII